MGTPESEDKFPVLAAEPPTLATTGENGGRTVGSNPATGAKEPSAYARATAFNILTHHPDCLRDDVVMNDLIDDIAMAIERAREFGMEEVSRAWFTK